ncbi:hypothetical protein [Streptomyces hygroscopicus]|uniref:hypothetical protein n=1 Tax=Streptomyces hygroscopicus TaxID=1912 RepID=UPI0014714BF1|nr:hypothetical protein [Streptomyces hygroscopicus]
MARLESLTALLGGGVGWTDVDALADCGGLLHDPVDGGGVYNGAVDGAAVDIVKAHDLEAQSFSLRLILLEEN